jgi:LysR family positive regulator for ilvC
MCLPLTLLVEKSMDIKALKQFQHLASSLNFSKTASAMFVSPPTLTRSIMRLEEECNASLFLRNNRNVQLTQAGRKLLAFSDETLTRYHQLQGEMARQKEELSGELSFYCSVTAAQTYLPTILDSMRQLYPSVDIKLETGDHELALQRIGDLQSDNVADLAIAIHTPGFPANIQFQSIDTVPLTLIVPASIDINTLDDISWRMWNVIMPATGPSRRIVNHWFAEQNIRPKIYAKVSGNEAIVSMVSLGLGIGFVPRIVLENSTVKNKVKSIHVPNIEAYRLGLCYLKERAHEPLIQSISQLFSQ